eukprot:jgi/Undpi1/1844/HiC_scaffold_12.g05231.m1
MSAVALLAVLVMNKDDLREDFGSLEAARASWGVFLAVAGWTAVSFVALAAFHTYLLLIGLGTFDWVVLQRSVGGAKAGRTWGEGAWKRIVGGRGGHQAGRIGAQAGRKRNVGWAQATSSVSDAYAERKNGVAGRSKQGVGEGKVEGTGAYAGEKAGEEGRESGEYISRRKRDDARGSGRKDRQSTTAAGTLQQGGGKTSAGAAAVGHRSPSTRTNRMNALPAPETGARGGWGGAGMGVGVTPTRSRGGSNASKTGPDPGAYDSGSSKLRGVRGISGGDNNNNSGVGGQSDGLARLEP